MGSVPNSARAVRDLGDAHVTALTDLDPFQATWLGVRSDRMRDFSPAGYEAEDELSRRTLAELDRIDVSDDPDERRCARLLRERLTSALDVSASGEHLRAVQNILGPVQAMRLIFTVMPTATADDWTAVARRMAELPRAVAGYRATLTEGVRRGLLAAPRQVTTLVNQLQEWCDAGGGKGWFAEFTASANVPAALRGELDAAARTAIESTDELRAWLAVDYLPRTEGTPDAVGAERYQILTRFRTGANLDLAEAYEWGWSEYRRLAVEQREQAERVLPGGTLREVIRHLDAHGEVVVGVEEIRVRLQGMIDQALTDLDGTHFDLAEQVKTVESRIAPPGSAAAPYYSRPAQDFSRPGRTWLPTLGRTRFPLWKLVSTWYHESVPGHHLQFAHWATLAGRLSRYQTGVGSVSAMTEGWALYAERLMDELGYLVDPGARLGYIGAQMRRAIRVIIDIGMHLELTIPSDSPVGPGERWTPELGRALLSTESRSTDAFVESELVRYLGVPAQAIGYKLGERAWLAGRQAAQANRGKGFDLKAWHMSALSLGALGLDDLANELARL
ncbi:MAG TPA: DUF885 domain-containing protein [Pseudonocardiaceae bacterium]|nr:DUF885 domain-containing protein [Pseudonocardiaceae bacterium]